MCGSTPVSVEPLGADVRKRLRKKRQIGEFARGAVVLRWLAPREVPHLAQANVLAALDYEVIEPMSISLFRRGFGSENEWFEIFVPTRRTVAIPPELATRCEAWLSRQPGLSAIEARHFQTPADANEAYASLLADFDTRHPDNGA